MVAHTAKAHRRKHIINKAWWVIQDHPFEFGNSIALIFFGFSALGSGLGSAPGAFSGTGLPEYVGYLFCGLSTIGGSSILVGLFTRYRYEWAYGFERMGLYIASSAWISYMIGLSFTLISPRSTLVICALGALAFACIMRAISLERNEKATVYALRKFNQDQESNDSSGTEGD